MKIYMDENVPQKVASRVREEGYVAEYVPRSIQDEDILAQALRENALLITSDKDFERLVLDEGKPTAGVVILRISKRIPMEDRAQIVVNMLRKYKDKLRGACGFLSEGVLDIRRPLRSP